MRSQPQSSRRTTSAQAKLVLQDGSSVPCTIVNVSSGGARIDVPQEAVVPPECHLASEELNIAAEATIAWRFGSQVGIRFSVKQHVPRARTDWVEP